MQELRWLDHLPGESIEGRVELVNEFYWNISSWEHEGKWYCQSGECTLLVTDSKQAMDAFLYGLSLSYSVIPEHILAPWKAEMDDELKDFC
jgi:hypothetical protein